MVLLSDQYLQKMLLEPEIVGLLIILPTGDEATLSSHQVLVLWYQPKGVSFLECTPPRI